jgi:hypothetical protein
MTSPERPRGPGDEEITEMDRHEEAGDASDVVEGEIGSARLKDPTRVETEDSSADLEELPGDAENGGRMPLQR